MPTLTEADLVRIRQALEKPTLMKSIETMEATLEELGFIRQVSLDWTDPKD